MSISVDTTSIRAANALKLIPDDIKGEKDLVKMDKGIKKLTLNGLKDSETLFVFDNTDLKELNIIATPTLVSKVCHIFCLLSDIFPVFQTSGKVEVLSGINGVIICQFIVPIQPDASPCLVKLPTFSIKHTQGPTEGSPEMKDAVQVGTSLKVC